MVLGAPFIADYGWMQTSPADINKKSFNIIAELVIRNLWKHSYFLFVMNHQ